MGHRTLVAYRQSDGTFTLRYAHWGEGLAADISPEMPFGGPTDGRDGPDASAIADRLDADSDGGYDPQTTTRVDPHPLADGVTAEGVLAAIDVTIESLVVVSPAYETATYLVCSLDPTASGDDIVLARPDGDPKQFRAWFVEVSSRLSGTVASDMLTAEAARETLRRVLASRAAVYPTSDASFLRDQ